MSTPTRITLTPAVRELVRQYRRYRGVTSDTVAVEEIVTRYLDQMNFTLVLDARAKRKAVVEINPKAKPSR